MRILVGTPMYDLQVLAPYHLAMMDTVVRFARQRPEVTFVNRLLDTASVNRSRNALASMVLEDPSFTHLLFIDADMGFRPSLIEKLIGFDMPMVSALSPKRSQDFARIVEVARRISDPELARYVSQSYVGESQDVVREPDGGIRVRRGFIRLRRTGTGIMLIQRTVFEQMRERFPELAAPADALYKQLGVRSEVFQAFEAFPGPNGIYHSEDYAFTSRWADGCGGEIWACIDEVITHVGREQFVGHFARKLAAASGVGVEAGPVEASQ